MGHLDRRTPPDEGNPVLAPPLLQRRDCAPFCIRIAFQTEAGRLVSTRRDDSDAVL